MLKILVKVISVAAIALICIGVTSCGSKSKAECDEEMADLRTQGLELMKNDTVDMSVIAEAKKISDKEKKLKAECKDAE